VTLDKSAWPSPEDLAAILALESVKGFGPQKFKALHEAGVTPAELLRAPSDLPLKGKRAVELRAGIAGLHPEDLADAERRAARQLERAEEYNAHLLVYSDPRYPRNVLHSNNPVPVIYARGNVEVLGERRAVACVGSRGISAPYERLHDRFVRVAVDEGFTVVSGFAMGADSIGHRAARDAGGRTVCVMPNGLDRPFPPENTQLWEELLEYPEAVMISEFPFGRGADSLTLRKRNKLIVACALGVLVSESSTTGGAMNAFRFAMEQRKPTATFESDGSGRSSGNAKIRDETKADTTALRDDEGSWRKWLARLSS
jgi:DNA protecting protein DprA